MFELRINKTAGIAISMRENQELFIALFAIMASLLLLFAVEIAKDSRGLPENDEVLSESEKEFSEFQEDLKWVILEVLLENMQKHPNDASKWDVPRLKEIYGVLARAKSSNVFDLGMQLQQKYPDFSFGEDSEDSDGGES